MVTYTFTNGTVADADEVNQNFTDVMNLSSPVGSVVAWLKNYTNTPTLTENWVECNGQTLNDGESVFNGQVIPDLNNQNKFLQGNSTSGGIGGYTFIPLNNNISTTVSGAFSLSASHASFDTNAETFDNRPDYYNVVWIMRIK